VHRQLESLFPNDHYLTATTREPENLDPSVPGSLGKMYLQVLLRNAVVELALARRLQPEQSHAFLCGNPQMIGFPNIDPQGRPVYPKPTGMVELLVARDFHCGDRHTAGNIHHKYWQPRRAAASC
jgi:ferredoxin--NADP+ reductase